MAIRETGLRYVNKDLSPFINGVERASGAITNFSKTGVVATGALLKVGSALTDAALGFAKLGAGAIIGAGSAILDFASDSSQAINDFQASLGVTRDEAARLGDVAKDVFGSNFGDSMADAAESVTEVRLQMKGLTDDELAGATKAALALRDTFGTDVSQSTNAANTLMKNFGLTAQQAFDFITAGQQKGLNASGDFLDTISEYGNLFGNAEMGAGQFFSLLETGLQGGVLGTDKIADAFKEFQIRWLEGGDEVIYATEQLGFEFSDLATKVQSGELSMSDVFGMLLPKLNEVDQAMTRNTFGVSLFGTQWEDLGSDAFAALDLTKTSLTDLAGSTDLLNAKYNNWPSMWEGIKRSALVALEPLGTKLLEVANDIMPVVQEGLGWLETNLPPMIDTAADAFDDLVGGIKQVLIDIEPVTSFVSDNLRPILAGLAAALLTVVIPAFVAWSGAAITAATATIAALAPVVLPIVAIGAAIALLFKAWETDFGGIRTVLTSFWEQTGRPIFESLKTWLGTNIPVAIAAVSTFFTETLWPALNKVWSFLDANVLPILDALANVWIALVKKEIEVLSALWSNVLWPALQKVWQVLNDDVIPVFGAAAQVAKDTLGPALGWMNDNILHPMIGWIGDISSAFDTLIGYINDAAEAIDNFELPDFMVGHSPPPWAKWIDYVSAALKSLNTIAAESSDIWANLLDADALIGMTEEMREFREEQIQLLDALPDAIQNVADRATDFLDKMHTISLTSGIGGLGTTISNLQSMRRLWDDVEGGIDGTIALTKKLEDATKEVKDLWDSGTRGEAYFQALERRKAIEEELKLAKQRQAVAENTERSLDQARAEFLKRAETDPENAQKLFALQSRQIKDLADIDMLLLNAKDDRTRQSLQKERDFLVQQQAIELELFNKQAQSRVNAIEEAIRSIADAFNEIEFPEIGIDFTELFYNLTRLIGQLGQAQLPDWIIPGSPTPLEMGIRGISAAMNQMSSVAIPAMRMQFNRLAMLATPSQMAAGNNNSVYAPVNHYNLKSYTNNSPHQVYQSYEIMRSQYGG